MSTALLTVSGLTASAGGQAPLHEAALRVWPGRGLAVIGESGSGKTTLGLAVQGEHRGGIELSGSVRLRGTELLGLGDDQRRTVRAGSIGYLPQHPAAVLNPVRRIGRVLEEYAAVLHRDRPARRAAVADAMRAARLPADPSLLRRYPHQLSGGQQQRVALAQALITRPDILILDEPTTGLDTVTKAETADRLARLIASGTALVLLTHDLPLARQLADDVLVLREGRVVEHGPGTQPLHRPSHEHTRELLAAEPGPDVSAMLSPVPEPGGDGLEVRELGHRARDGAWLVRGVNLVVPSGHCLGVVGRSGAGKTTLARCLAGLARPSEGQVLLDGVSLPATRRSLAQRRRVQYVHQDASASFDEFRPVGIQVARTAELLRGLPAGPARREADELLESLGVRAEQGSRRPGRLSGGQLRRAALARALLARPDVLICDEITAGLDVLNQAELLKTLAHQRCTRNTTLVLISHDLGIIAAMADQVCLLDEGRCREPERSLGPQRVAD